MKIVSLAQNKKTEIKMCEKIVSLVRMYSSRAPIVEKLHKLRDLMT